MEKGQWVLVKAFPDKTLERIVWEENRTYVVVCRPEVYGQAIALRAEPVVVMGFPKEDVMVKDN